MIRDEILRHLSEANLPSCGQHGLRPRRSCNTRLVEVLDEWGKSLELWSLFGVLYLNFRKAFDSVLHHRLLIKLNIYGSRGEIVAWIMFSSPSGVSMLRSTVAPQK